MTLPFLTSWTHRWATASQHTARRNAMLATTVLTQQRIERMEVEEFLAALAAEAVPAATRSTTPAAPPRAAHG